MAEVIIRPIPVPLQNGSTAVISGIDVTDPDCIQGSITNSNGTTTPAQWNKSGILRGGSAPGDNLPLSNPNVKDLMDTVTKLGAS